MSAYTQRRPSMGSAAPSGASTSATGAAPQQPQSLAPPPLHQQPQPVASSSRNPQLGPNPYFSYPTPTPEQIEEELPPYFEGENVPLGPLLDRLARKSYGEMKVLVEKTLPPLAPRQKPKQIVEYAKTTRQAVLKYLAVLRWKTSVDLHSTAPSAQQTNGQPPGPTVSFPTPHSNGESNDTSPTAYPSKGKGVTMDGSEETAVRGKVTDARRIQHFLEHQNVQHDIAIKHIRHVTGLVDTLRERNADLMTALSVRSTGTYTRLPSSITETFVPPPALNPRGILNTMERLNEHTLYRLRCVDYVPPDLVIDRVADGRVYVRGGGPNGWTAQVSLVGFDDDSRWWLCGLEWAWCADGASPKAFTAMERRDIFDMCNRDVLVPREVVKKDDEMDTGQEIVDAPLVRLYNFLQHLSLMYQLEVLYSQAITISQGRWRNQLQVEIDRPKKELKLRYWIRSRPQAKQQQQAQPQSKRGQAASSSSSNQGPMFGGTLTVSLAESTMPLSEAEMVLRDVTACGMEPVDRTLRFGLSLKWEVGEAGAGSGLKAGDPMDASILRIDSSALSMKEVMSTATRAHAAHLARGTTAPLLTNERLVNLDPLNPPRIDESETSTRPVSLIIPLPSRGQLSVSVSSISGLLEIEDSIARDSGQVLETNRTLRAKLATGTVNEHKSRLADDVYRLAYAIIVEDIDDKLRQLGLHPLRRVALRTHDLQKTDLNQTSNVFVPLPVSQSHYFVAKVTPTGIQYELLKLLRVPMDNGSGMKMAVGDRIPIDLTKLLDRRAAKGTKRAFDEEGDPDVAEVLNMDTDTPATRTSAFQVDVKDLQDMLTYCNALVAQTMVEQQLKDRGIPYATLFPDENDFAVPRSRSALAGMVPNICIDASHIFKDHRAAEVASTKVFLVIKNWWKGTQCSVETIVRLRHQPSLANDNGVGQVTPAANDGAARSEAITFDQNTLTVRFHAPSIARCVPDFLEQWERLSKVIVVAGEVNRLAKLEQFRDIRMLSFDLRTASVQYAPGFNVAITYTPSSDSYEATFFRSITTTPAPVYGTPAIDGEPNPHQLLAPLLSHHLNELTQLNTATGEGNAGKDFIQLLRSTLPLLLEAESLRVSSASEFPALVVRGISEYRLVWDHETSRYALDIILTSGGKRFLLCDATRRKGVPEDLTCGPLTAIPNINQVMVKGFQAAKIAKVGTPGSAATLAASTPATAMTPRDPKTPKDGKTPRDIAARDKRARSVTPVMPPAVRLDNGESILCSVGVVQDVLRAMAAEIETSIVGIPTGPGSARS